MAVSLPLRSVSNQCSTRSFARSTPERGLASGCRAMQKMLLSKATINHSPRRIASRLPSRSSSVFQPAFLFVVTSSIKFARVPLAFHGSKSSISEALQFPRSTGRFAPTTLSVNAQRSPVEMMCDIDCLGSHHERFIDSRHLPNRC